MTVQILSRFSDLLYDRPFPTRLGVFADGVEMALNHNPGDPGLYFADSTSGAARGLIKIGPTFVGSTAPNLTPTGYASLSRGNPGLIQPVQRSLKYLMAAPGKQPMLWRQSVQGNHLIL